MPNTHNRHSELRSLLPQLNLGAMADVFADVAIRASGLPAENTFRTLALTRLSPALQLQLERLKSASFLETATNILAIGKPGVGKSHCLAAVGYELIYAGHSVLWTPTSMLVQRLLAAKRDLRLPQELAKLDKFACVILDDIGSVQHDRDEMEVLFTFLAERYERKSVMITTNLVFSEWERIFKDPMTTMAAIDRLVHHSVILDMMSIESYRAEVASQQHLSSARSKKMVSGRRTTPHEAAPVPAQEERDASGPAVAEKPSEDLLIDGIKSARVIAADGPV